MTPPLCPQEMGKKTLVYINTLLVQKVLAEKEWLEKMQPEDFRGLTPLFYGHIKPYGFGQVWMPCRICLEFG
jgi:hypothetical protein